METGYVGNKSLFSLYTLTPETFPLAQPSFLVPSGDKGLLSPLYTLPHWQQSPRVWGHCPLPQESGPLEPGYNQRHLVLLAFYYQVFRWGNNSSHSPPSNSVSILEKRQKQNQTHNSCAALELWLFWPACQIQALHHRVCPLASTEPF